MSKTTSNRRQSKKRPYGSGALIKKSNGIYAYQYRDAAGKRLTRSLGTRNFKEAEKLASPLRATASAQNTIEAVQQIARTKEMLTTKKLLLTDVWEAFMHTRPSAGDGTLKLYRHALENFIGWVNLSQPQITDLADIDEQAAADWLAYEWKRNISASTYNDRRGSMLTITKNLMRPYRLSSNPWSATERKKMAGRQQQRLPLTREHVQALLSENWEQDIKGIMLLSLCAGMRLKDAANLKWADISGGFISYTPEKTKRTSGVRVQVPLLPALSETLEELPRTSEYVLPRLADKYARSAHSLSKLLVKKLHSITGKAVQDPTGRGKVARSAYGFHSLRHTFCTEAARAGVPATLLAAMAGDNITTVEKFYVKLDLTARPIEQVSSIARTINLVTRSNETEREKLKQLADNLPLDDVRAILKQYTSKN